MSFISSFFGIFDKGLLPVLLASIVFVAGYVSRPIYERRSRRKTEKQAFASQCEDLKRHFQANTNVIKSIIRDKKSKKDGWCLRIIHLEKLRLLAGMADFNFDLYQALPAKDAGVIQQHKLLMRNIEIDIAEAIHIYQKEDDDSLYEFLAFLVERFEGAHSNIERTLRGEDFQQMPITISYKNIRAAQA